MASSSDYYLAPYRDAQERMGTEFGVTLWANEGSQKRRFAAIAEMVPLQGRRVLDAGCSRGDFAAFLTEQSVGYGRFIGVDGLPEVIAHAQTRNLPRAEFHHGDFVANPSLLRIGEPDIITISGTLNTMKDETVDALLEAAWEATGHALVFNFLSDRCGPKAPPQGYPARRLDTLSLLDWALLKTWAVQFRQDYFPHGHDATILMRKV